LRLLERAVRWNDVEGSKVGFRTGLQGFNELRQVRRNDKRGLYDAALERARDLAPVIRAERPTLLDTEAESDVSPELAGQRI
jgi:hypothetical protein